MKYKLLTFNVNWADEHNVPALECMTEEEYNKWRDLPINDDSYEGEIYCRLGNSGEGFDEYFEGYTDRGELVDSGMVSIHTVTEEFYNTFKLTNLSRLSLCNIFDQ